MIYLFAFWRWDGFKVTVIYIKDGTRENVEAAWWKFRTIAATAVGERAAEVPGLVVIQALEVISWGKENRKLFSTRKSGGAAAVLLLEFD